MTHKATLNETIESDVTFENITYKEYRKVIVTNSQSSITFVNCVFLNTLDFKALFQGIPEYVSFHKCYLLTTKHDRAISVNVNTDIPNITFHNCYIEDLNIEDCNIKFLNLYNTFTGNLFTHAGYKIDFFKIEFDFNTIEALYDAKNTSHLDFFFQNQKKITYLLTKGYDLFEFSMNEIINKYAREYTYFESLGDYSLSRLNIYLGITGGATIQTDEKVRIKNSTFRSFNLKEKFNNIEVRNIKTNVFGLENFQANIALFYQINYSEFNHTQIVKNYIKEKKEETAEIIDKIKSGSLSEDDIRRYESQKHENESKIKEFKGKSIFNITKSDLKNCSFWHISFNGFERINFFNTNIEDAKFSMVKLSNVVFSSSENIYNDQWYNRRIDFKEEYDIYRQFVNVFSKNGDVYNSLKAKSFQMKALLKFNDINWKTKLILYINKLTNDFGNSASRAFFVIIIAAILFYSLFMGTMYDLDISWKGKNFYFSHVKYLFSIILNPLSTTTKLDELNANNYTYFIVFLSKIIMAFLYYQFVAAYRRFGKSEK